MQEKRKDNAGGQWRGSPPPPGSGRRRVLYVMSLGVLALFGSFRATRATKESYMHEVLNEIYLQNFFMDRCNFSRRI